MDSARTFWLTGLPCSGKTTIATELASRIRMLGHAIVAIDGDDVRTGLCSDLGFSSEDRNENIRRISMICELCNKNGVIAIASFVSPTNDLRIIIDKTVQELNTIHVATPLEVCEARDVKGMYALARSGKIPDFTGVDAPFEIPFNSDMELDTKGTVEESVDRIIKHFSIK